MTHSRIFSVLSVALTLTAFLLAEDWPQWRGPNRDGVVSSFPEPRAWPEQLKLKWKVTVGEGHSSPIVGGGVIFLHARQDEKEVVSARQPENGQVIWQHDYPAPYTMNPAARGHGKGVKSTPALNGGRLYTLGISETLSCWDAKSGKLLWGKDASPDATGWRAYSPVIKGKPLFRTDAAPATYGTAMSPLVDRGLVIVHVGAAGLVAFDAATGAEKWSWKDDKPAYASPVAAEFGGVRQIVTFTEQNIVSVSEADGRLLWKMPFTTNFSQNAVTPVVYGQSLILSGLNNGTMAVRPLKRGNEWTTEKLWENKDISMYMNSPVLSDDLLFGLSHRNKGQFFCMDARTGKTLWTTAGREGDNAAIVSAGSVLLLLKDNGDLLVAKKSAQAFEPVRRYKVADSATWAHPVPFEKGILVKDVNSLALWGLE